MDAATKSVMDDPVLMESHLKEAMKRSKKDLKLSEDEEDRLTKAFKEPEFKQLMNDYLTEISDPKNRAEYEQYINQLEKDNKVPKGTKLVRPVGSFCVKCKKMGTGEKMFINICGAPDAGIATSTSTSKGQSWNLPHLMGPPHMEQDKSKTPCMTFDVCFHPDTIKKAEENVRFQQLLVTTALETIKENTKKHGQTVQVEKDYRILKGVKAMGGKPNMLSVKLSESEEAAGSGASSDSLNAAAKSLASQHTKQEKNKNKKKNKKKKEKEKETKKKEIFKCVVVESGTFDMRNHMERENADSNVHRHRPQKLVVRVTLDGLTSLANVELDVSERAIVLKVPGKPTFEKRLPYPVNSDKGKAKFNKSTSVLQVTVPVLPPAPEEEKEEEEGEEEMMPMTEEGEFEKDCAGLVEEMEVGGEKEKEKEKEKEEVPTMAEVAESLRLDAVAREAKEERAKAEKNEEKKEEEEKEEKEENEENEEKEEKEENEEKTTTKEKKEIKIPAGLDPEMMKKIREARAAYASWASKGTENEQKATELKNKEAAERRVVNDALPLKDGNGNVVVLTDDAPLFLSSSEFDGAKPGYVFQSGESGVGYYLDKKHREKRMVSGKKTSAQDSGTTSTTDDSFSDALARLDVLGGSDGPLETAKNTAEEEKMTTLEIPPHRFRQDKRSLTLLVQVAGIDESKATVQFTLDAAILHFVASGGQEYGLRLVPPKGMTLLPTQSRFSVSDRNMAVVIAKEQPEKWGSDMRIEAISSAEVLAVVAEEQSEEKDVSNPPAPEGVGTASLLTNTLMYALS